MADPKTQEMRLSQIQRERSERDRAQEATEENETATHERRADRAAYLEEKLAERERSEDAANG